MFDYHLIDDIELSKLISKGDALAFEQLYKRYSAVLLLHARKMLKDDCEAKDVLQDIFTKVWQKREAIVFYTSIKSYLYAAVKNKILNKLTHRKFEVSYFAQLKDTTSDSEANTDFKLRERELAILIEKEIDALPPKMKEVFELSRKKHLSHKEIAEQLAISDKTVKKQISNALNILRPKISALYSLL